MNSTLNPDAIGIGFGIGFVVLIGFAILLSLALFALWIWMLVDCAQTPDDPSNPNQRLIWILVLVFTGWLGAILYYFIVRQPRLAARRTRGFTSPPLPRRHP